MDRRAFLSQVGIGAAVVLMPACLGGLAGCKKTSTTASNTTAIDMILNVSSGALATNGGFLVTNGVIVARTMSGTYIAVSAACTHQGTNVSYNSSNNDFVCPSHGAMFSSTGTVTQGPASTNLTKYNTTLTGTSLRVYS